MPHRERLDDMDVRGSRRPSWRVVAAAVVVVMVSWSVATWAGLRVPDATGSFEVGRRTTTLVDGGRDEAHTPASDHRNVPVLVWYPSEDVGGRAAPYVPNLDTIGDGLVASGALSSVAVKALRFVETAALEDVEVADDGGAFPVVFLSPGNLTNVAFYASIAEDLASHGYIVIGIDHPFGVGAVELTDGSVATTADRPLEEGSEAEISSRAADMSFVMDALEDDDARLGFLAGRADLDRVAVMGHSLGGIAAAEVCRDDERFDACLNIDGQQAGGPFSTDPEGSAPEQPFMYLTKETEIHPVLVERFEARGEGAFRVIVPAAAHEAFTDGPLFEPRVVPWVRAADEVVGVTRGFTRAFFDHVLRGAPVDVLGDVDAHTDVYVNVYPLGDKPNLPR